MIESPYLLVCLQALPPLHTVHGLEGIVQDFRGGSDSVSLGVQGVVQVYLGVEVQGCAGITRRPDPGVLVQGFMEVIRVIERADQFFFQRGLIHGEASKPRVQLMSNLDTVIQGRIAREVELVDGVLIVQGVVEIDVEVAVLTILDDRDPRADGRDEFVESQGEI